MTRAELMRVRPDDPTYHRRRCGFCLFTSRRIDALTTAIDRLASDSGFRERCARNMQALRGEFSWEQTMAPLTEFCRDPSTTVVSRTEKRLPAATRTLDWLASRTYYEARFGLKRKAATWRKNMIARHFGGEESGA